MNGRTYQKAKQNLYSRFKWTVIEYSADALAPKHQNNSLKTAKLGVEGEEQKVKSVQNINYVTEIE